MFSDSDSEAGEDFQLTINEHYAKAFEYKKEREELEKLKAEYGSDAEEDEEESESDSESDESEDEDGEELTPAIDAAILRTLARIKRKDPEIYDSKSGIFQEEQDRVGPAQFKVKQQKDKSKPVTIRQVALEAALDTGSRSPSPVPLTHAEEQKRLRDETIAAFHEDGDDEGDNFLVPREKTKDELEREEEEYREFLEREVGSDLRELVTVDSNGIEWEAEKDTFKTGSKDKKEKKKKAKTGASDKKQSKEEADQEFLMNYIMNRGWIDRSVKRVPTYKEITSTTDKGKAKEVGEEEEEDEGPDSDKGEGGDQQILTNESDMDDDDFDEIVDRFESSYNFRFEEPDGAQIKQYPRQLESTVRREEGTRKEARKRRKQRKEEELQKRREEVKRMKALKMKELRIKLDKIGKEGGKNFENDPALQDLDLDAEWDPDAHDKQMEGLYGEDAEYEDDAQYDENGKPVWNDDIDIGDIHMSDDQQKNASSKKDKKKKKKKKKKDEDGVDEVGVDVDDMDADVEKDDDEEWDGTEETRKRKLDEYMDEIYGLDFNDVVGGMSTRFHYTKVKLENFALTPVEILLATDKELNEYMSIKKYAPYRNDTKWDTKRNERLKELKARIAQRRDGQEFVPTGSNNIAQAPGERPAKKRKGKKERMKEKMAAKPEEDTVKDGGESSGKRKRPSDEEAEEEEEKVSIGGAEKRKKKRRRHRKKEAGSDMS